MSAKTSGAESTAPADSSEASLLLEQPNRKKRSNRMGKSDKNDLAYVVIGSTS
ncbi:MAG: hypothetical protein ACTIJA_00840 [Bavariicoccus seileri]|uniref:hypothetical protein n=1 Tax=Bavariicoccus seileri TaxID=549685 RepID=UPI0003B3C3B5|nr:hypothetical protein [Bavariicoccus seileri]